MLCINVENKKVEFVFTDNKERDKFVKYMNYFKHLSYVMWTLEYIYLVIYTMTNEL